MSIIIRTRWLALVLAILLLTSACGDTEPAATETGPGMPHPSPPTMDNSGHSHEHAAGSPAPGDADAAMQVYLVASELVVGQNRFAVGLTLPDNSIVDDAEVTFEYFDLSNPAAPLSESKATATRLSSIDGMTVIYAQERTFERAGDWGVLIDAKRADGTQLTRNISFEVLADSPTLAIGDSAPSVDSPTIADVEGDLTKLTSASQPNPAFYELSIADALADHKPTVILFATPSFCQTRFCGPDYEIVSDLQQRYGDQLNFVHVEVYSGLPNPAANGWQFNQPLRDFGLQTEPWLYVIDAGGVVTWRIEGLFTEGEVVAALQAVGIANQ